MPTAVHCIGFLPHAIQGSNDWQKVLGGADQIYSITFLHEHVGTYNVFFLIFPYIYAL